MSQELVSWELDPVLLLKGIIYVRVLRSTYSDEIDISCLTPHGGWSNFEDKIIQKTISSVDCYDKASPRNYENIQKKERS